MEDIKFEQVLKLVNTVSDSALTELKYEDGDLKLCLKKAADGVMQALSVPEAAAAGNKSDSIQAAPQEKKERSGFIVKSPLVGTFYSSPSENAEPYVSVGDRVEKGQVLAIVEAMKLMNEIESEVSGEIEEILVQNEETVEYGQPLFIIKVPSIDRHDGC